MAKASAWLAVVIGFPLSIIFFLSIIQSGQNFWDRGFAIVGLIEMSLLLAGGGVVLARRKPGLRLLAAGWALTIGVNLGLGLSPLRPEGPQATDQPTFYIALIISLCGLVLALLARRPHHKN